MRKIKKEKGHSFIIEFTLCLVIFSVVCSLVISIFAKADRLNDKAEALSFANIQIQNVAEWIRVGKSKTDLEELCIQNGAIRKDEGYHFMYKGYTLILTWNEEPKAHGVMTHFYIQFVSSEEILAKLEIDKYYIDEGAEK